MRFTAKLLLLIVLSCSVIGIPAFASDLGTYTDGNNVITISPNNTFVMITTDSSEDNEEKAIITVKGYFDNMGNACITGCFDGDLDITSAFSVEKLSAEKAAAEALYPEKSSTEKSPDAAGWDIYETTIVNENVTEVLPADVQSAFTSSTKDLMDMVLTPTAYLGSQAADGTNYQILCIGRMDNPEVNTRLYVVTIHVDADNIASVTQIADFNIDYYESSAKSDDSDFSAGTWTAAEAPDTIPLPEDARKAFDNTITHPGGASFKPSALLASKTGDGTEYAFLCYTVAADKDAPAYNSLVFIKEDADGQLSIVNIVPLDLADFNQLAGTDLR